MLLCSPLLTFCGTTDRDLKPANILVLSDCQLRITDFGLARRIKSQPSDKKENDPAGDLNLTGCEWIIPRRGGGDKQDQRGHIVKSDGDWRREAIDYSLLQN